MKKVTILESVVFHNNKTNESQPDLTGNAETLVGKLSIALWKKTSKNGKEYYSLLITKTENDEQLPTTQTR